ncbi:hypothetical protein VTJ49DRAFT_7007 [Mycothermus thermophilus]|uniref:Uncharacterized protein n=1 Tax=Humicola insolens TaxID=85995 RepID=A0ABR3V0K4_HUMIN
MSYYGCGSKQTLYTIFSTPWGGTSTSTTITDSSTTTTTNIPATSTSQTTTSQTTSTSPAATNDSNSSSSSTPVDAIVGGVVGGVVALELIATGIIWMNLRSRRNSNGGNGGNAATTTDPAWTPIAPQMTGYATSAGGSNPPPTFDPRMSMAQSSAGMTSGYFGPGAIGATPPPQPGMQSMYAPVPPASPPIDDPNASMLYYNDPTTFQQQPASQPPAFVSELDTNEPVVRGYHGTPVEGARSSPQPQGMGSAFSQTQWTGSPPQQPQ